MNDYIINTIDNVALVTMNGVANTADALAKIFTAIGDAKINIDMICQTAPYKDRINLSFTIDERDLTSILTVVGGLKKDIPELVTEVAPGNAKVTIFSELLKTESGVAAKVFSTISENGMQIKLITTSDVEISLLVSAVYAEKMAKTLSSELGIRSEELGINY